MRTSNFTRLVRCKNRTPSTFAAALRNLGLATALLIVFSIPACASGWQQDQSKEKLGSLTSLGEVYLNDAPTAVMSAVSSGDKIRTGETGEATLTVAGKGTLKIRPLSEVVLPGSDQYIAELQKGTVLLNSVPDSDGLILRIGNYVVVSSVRSLATALRVTRAEDGSFLVYCLDGKVGILTMEGQSGQLLQAGQSLTLSAKSEILVSAPAPTPKPKRNSHTLLIVLGLAGAGAAGAAAALAHGGGNHTVTIQ